MRERYFLVRFPPFTASVRHDSALLIAESEAEAAAEALQLRLARSSESAIAAPDSDTAALTFEHRVLESVLHEDTLHKRDRYERLSALIHTTTAPPPATVDGGIASVHGFFNQREAALYRLLTLSKSLTALALDVKRSSAALAQLLSSDEDMANTYLSFRQQSGAQRSIDDHIDVELMLESYATEHEDLGDNIEELQDEVSTHRLLEQVKLSNERNRIMRLELMLSFGTCSLAICATMGGFFGMNLHSGLENVPHLLLYVSGGTGLAASGVFAAFVLSLKRFHAAQQRQVESTASLDRAIDVLDTAYFTLRQAHSAQRLDGLDTAHGTLLTGEPTGAASGAGGDGLLENAVVAPDVAASVPRVRLPITREGLHTALQRCAQREGGEARPINPNAVDELWEMLDANGDGVLTAEELHLGEKAREPPRSAAPARASSQ